MMQHELRRTEMLLGAENLEKLHQAKVVLLGLGGVGGAAFEALVRGGVGHLTVVDNDIFTVSNLNRQLLATYDNLGQSKVFAALARGKAINRYCTVVGMEAFINGENLAELIAEDTDYVIDAIDTVTAKLQVITYCKEKNIPVISSMGTGNKLDPGQLQVTDLAKTTMCPLAKVMRHELRKRGITSVKVVASTEKPRVPHVLEPVAEEGPVSQMKKRSAPGSTSFVPPTAGFLLAGAVIRDLLGSDLD
ncbi:tRNA threonylcarbamoyladenosine dehydratase [Proteiniclasticum sp. BAD-10]|uniref:tRNA threonylcarbamoyladenosine dehydratase n=1 Tax=Proteiniclasticum sediminis TaxID=2804028 RepID=A0A941CSZ6_9CLOT|nr:tRNA threonylcarbamoyladenosine dehydratase [Proteiniclasticum sediminis]MBR0577009.1 tRNA threonylcarbamoyladenosine dehydratase [Proteiniclasticum sediminis]